MLCIFYFFLHCHSHTSTRVWLLPDLIHKLWSNSINLFAFNGSRSYFGARVWCCCSPEAWTWTPRDRPEVRMSMNEKLCLWPEWGMVHFFLMSPVATGRFSVLESNVLHFLIVCFYSGRGTWLGFFATFAAITVCFSLSHLHHLENWSKVGWLWNVKSRLPASAKQSDCETSAASNCNWKAGQTSIHSSSSERKNKLPGRHSARFALSSLSQTRSMQYCTFCTTCQVS